MFQFRPLRFISIVLLCQKSAFAFPHLSPRDLDNIFNIDWGKIGGGIFTGIGAWGTEMFDSGDQPPDQQDTTTTTTPKDQTMPGPAPPGPLFSEPDYELGTPPQKPKAPAWEPSAPISQCDANIVSDDCGKVLDQLIFTTSCATIKKGQVPTEIAITQNGAILDALNAMAPGLVQTATSNLCGAFMFTAPLTKEQSQEIAGMPGVSRVSSNIFFEDSGSGKTNDLGQQPGVIEPAYKRRQLKKRDIVRQENAPAHLQFISTPENFRGISTDYVYDSRAGADTVVFPIGPGLTMNHREFINKPITYGDFIFADDVQPGSTLVDRSYGTCMASLIMGTEYGVSKQTKLKPVRIENSVESLIKGMVKIANFINDRIEDLGQPYVGFVMIMDMAWQDTDRDTTERFEAMLDLLLFDYDVITVVAAGSDRTNEYGQINSYPAYYAGSSPVIAVGAVDMSGERFSWSRGGTRGGNNEGDLRRNVAQTVSAVGSVICASNAGGSEILDLVFGSGIAAAQVAGLAAYFLSIYPHLRADQNPSLGAPAAVRNFIVNNAWARKPGGDIAIWNLMGPGTVDPSGAGQLPNSPY